MDPGKSTIKAWGRRIKNGEDSVCQTMPAEMLTQCTLGHGKSPELNNQKKNIKPLVKAMFEFHF